ncbi:hypothetical protein AAFN60_21550 [Roseibacillus persicicus]|uniref:hypothetical protein n=1 Tax=Roseibacillus persicicus TaxID=454148 RepID=UPI00398A510E
MKNLLPFAAILTVNSCALVTTPIKVAGSAAGAAVEVTGKAVGAGVSHLSRNKSE